MKFKVFAGQVRFIRQEVDAFIKENEPIEVHRFEVTPVPTALTMTGNMPTSQMFETLTEPQVVIAMWYEEQPQPEVEVGEKVYEEVDWDKIHVEPQEKQGAVPQV